MSKIIVKKDLDLVIESTLKEVGLVSKDDSCPTCGNPVCECDTPHDEGDDDSKYNDKLIDVVTASVGSMAESVKGTTKKEFLKEEMDHFNKLINHRK
jgi:hypothetical protein